jgi:hypothetical protein
MDAPTPPVQIVSDTVRAIRRRVVFLVAFGIVVVGIGAAAVDRRAQTTNIGSARAIAMTLACADTRFCVAGDDFGRLYEYNGASWSKPVSISKLSISALACPGAGRCVAGDSGGNVFTLRGTRWTKSQQHDTKAGAKFSPGGLRGITAASCSQVRSCVVADSVGQSIGYEAGVWGEHRAIDSTADAVSGLSCPMSGFCVAVTEGGKAVAYERGSWQAPQVLVPSSASDLDLEFGLPALTGVACADRSFCEAVAAGGSVYRFDGKKWSSPLAIDPQSATTGNHDGMTAVDCPSTTACIAADALGRVVRFDGRSWSAPEQIDPTLGISALSCPVPTFCMALDDLGRVLRYNGSSWSSPAAVA